MWIRSFIWFAFVFFLGRASAAPLDLAFVTCGDVVVATVTYDGEAVEVVFDADPTCAVPLVYAGDDTWIVEVETTDAGTSVTLVGVDGTFSDPVADLPGTDEPGTDEPGTDEPGTDEPGTDEPGTDEPGTDEPGTDEPGTDEPGTDEPGTDEPGTDEPGSDEPMVGNSGKPVSSLPAPAQAGMERAEENREAARERSARDGHDDGLDDDEGDDDGDGDGGDDGSDDGGDDVSASSGRGVAVGRR